uniref:Uncharacterized protein n=1 Tax=Glossina pallidipes TaxID=7398 RepID=A0A1A9ZHT5_GLOPL
MRAASRSIASHRCNMDTNSLSVSSFSPNFKRYNSAEALATSEYQLIITRSDINEELLVNVDTIRFLIKFRKCLKILIVVTSSMIFCPELPLKHSVVNLQVDRENAKIIIRLFTISLKSREEKLNSIADRVLLITPLNHYKLQVISDRMAIAQINILLFASVAQAEHTHH